MIGRLRANPNTPIPVCAAILAHPRSVVVRQALFWNGCVSCAHFPADPLLRNQMAVFKTTAFNLKLRGP